MDDFQFIIESPQHNQGHKKRPRLVTSCDNCRLKKIKCLQPSPEAKCEACKAAKIQCRFRDRERYFAERSRAIAGPGAASTYGDVPRSPLQAPQQFGRLSYDQYSPQKDANGRYQTYPPSSRRSLEISHRHTNSSPTSYSTYDSQRDESAYGYMSPDFGHVSSISPLSHAGSHQTPLFDAEHPQRPNPALMPHFIQVFFEHHGAEFPFMSLEDTMAQFYNQSLPPLLSNCIASLAVRSSNAPELALRGLHNVAEIYGDNAKTALSSVSQMPSMETLHGLMLLSWSEYKDNHISNFRLYCQTAMRLAMELGLSDQNDVPGSRSERERTRRRSTWGWVVQLHFTASSFRA